MRTRVLSSGSDEPVRYLNTDRKTKLPVINFTVDFGGKEKILELKKFKVSTELSYFVDYKRPSTHEKFLEQARRSSEYLFRKANMNQQTIKEYISDKVPRKITRRQSTPL